MPVGQLRRRLVEGRQRRLLLWRRPLHHRLQRHAARRRARAAARARRATGGAPAATSSGTGSAIRRSRCYGPVVCRVATCTPPWRYDASCTTASATDNKTVNHGAPCIPNCNPAPPPHAPSPASTRRSAARRASSAGRRQSRAAIPGTSGKLRRLHRRAHLLEPHDRRARDPWFDQRRAQLPQRRARPARLPHLRCRRRPATAGPVLAVPERPDHQLERRHVRPLGRGSTGAHLSSGSIGGVLGYPTRA